MPYCCGTQGNGNMHNDTLLITAALDFAARTHAGQRRKGAAAEPYVNHLIEVAQLVAEATDGSDAALVAAALLHDCIEDQGVTRQELAARFGATVADLVMEVTDDKRLPKAARKQAQVDHVAHASARAKMLKLADKTSNLRAIQSSPPPWPASRKRRYFAWAQAVAAGARGVNPALEAAFDAEVGRALASGVAEAGFVWHQGLETEGDD
jgi:(p)ppGpp synthase/HD superfamily hydrolase